MLFPPNFTDDSDDDFCPGCDACRGEEEEDDEPDIKYYRATIKAKYDLRERNVKDVDVKKNVKKELSDSYKIKNFKIVSKNVSLEILPHKFDVQRTKDERTEDDYLIIDFLCSCNYVEEMSDRMTKGIIFLLNKYINEYFAFSSKRIVVDDKNILLIKNYNISDFS